MTIEGWIESRWRGDRISWEELWFNMAHLVAMRARCDRDRVGAVIVTEDNVLQSTGYNGPPAGFYVEGWCHEWCPAAISGNRDHCPSVHAEVNALLRTPKPLRPGTVMYVTSTMCLNCAKSVAAAGVCRVVMKVKTAERYRHRDAETTIAFLKECGVEVVVWKEYHTTYSRIFVDIYGMGPHTCYFCEETMMVIETVHHIDHDHSNDDPVNLAAAHECCHMAYHKTNKIYRRAPHQKRLSPRLSVTRRWERVKPLISCRTCGLKTTPGWLRRHADSTGHDGTAYDEWRTEDERRRVALRTCDRCGHIFDQGRQLALHRYWSDRTGRCKAQDNGTRADVEMTEPRTDRPETELNRTETTS